MVDINNQILKLRPEEAQEEIAKLIGLGYTDIILTFPILENGDYEIEDMVSKFNMFKFNYKGINLYLGNEINYHYTLIHRLKKHDILTLNQSEYILLKLPADDKPEQFKQLISALSDYKVILSCADQYKYLNVNDLIEMKKSGILYLVNVKNINKHKTKKMLKKKLVDFLVTYENVPNSVFKQGQKLIGREYMQKLISDNYTNILKINL
jgi:tyrosine-protein phosphatase YwqE